MKKWALFFLLLCSSLSGFAQCADSVTFTANPMPTAGCYLRGTVITFTLNVHRFRDINSNWMDGVTLDFLNGWDTTTIKNITTAGNCSGQGEWYYNPDGFYHIYMGKWLRRGYYFDLDADVDTVSSNDAGDYNPFATCQYTFSWSIAVDSNATPGTVLIDTVVITGDNNVTRCVDKFALPATVCLLSDVRNVVVAGDMNIYQPAGEPLFALQVNAKKAGVASVTVTNLLGQIIEKANYYAQPGQNEWKLPFNHPPALYLLTVDNGSQRMTRKVIYAQ